MRNVFVRDRLVSLGRHPEDGEEIIRSRFDVIIEQSDGSRVAHRHVFTERDAAERFAEKVRVGLVSGQIDEDCWEQIDPAYGSVAYQNEEAEIVYAERQAEQEGF
jgi:predicted PolB exonuclease-like 3'-5' exonuclease